jgi:hypothetical protein
MAANQFLIKSHLSGRVPSGKIEKFRNFVEHLPFDFALDRRAKQ